MTTPAFLAIVLGKALLGLSFVALSAGCFFLLRRIPRGKARSVLAREIVLDKRISRYSNNGLTMLLIYATLGLAIGGSYWLYTRLEPAAAPCNTSHCAPVPWAVKSGTAPLRTGDKSPARAYRPAASRSAGEAAPSAR